MLAARTSKKHVRAHVNRSVEYSASGIEIVARIAMRGEPDQIHNRHERGESKGAVWCTNKSVW